MARVKSPLIQHTDSEVLCMTARHVDQEASRMQGIDLGVRRAMAARLRSIARRVPLWTDLEHAQKLIRGRS